MSERIPDKTNRMKKTYQRAFLFQYLTLLKKITKW